ncbi:glycosyltransferase [Sphingomonas canadensis]|uniref:Glycosyltransferase n=1 Tax=Sphingomonas canadensis TaxID=1219257 RepID=A0ABW3H439_9SPHN|nr:glycosyltransferase [Sphingomonas canadensis]MCW3835918.1 glycosyltransferase [Sphingomonas canadensis]
MLRVLTLATLFPDASRPNFGIFVERQTLSLARRGDVEIRVVAPVGIPPWPLSRHPRYRALAGLPDRERWKGIEVHRPRFLNLPGTGGRFHARMVARAAEPVIAAIRRSYRFDILVGEFSYPDGPAVVALAERFGVPCSFTARGADISHWAHQPATGAQIVAASRRASGMLAVSDALRDEMIALGMPGDRIRQNTTGVDLSRFAPRDRAAARRALGVAGPLVASVGALIPRKRHDIAIDAVARLPGVSLLIAGTGPEQGRLQARIDRLGVGDRVRLLGAVPGEAMPELLGAADVMALGSESEGLANVWMEALACGTPVVVPDVGGARQLLTAPAGGRIVARTPEAFADAIAATLASPPAPADVRALAEPFTWEANSARIHAWYSGLVAAGPVAAAA